MPQAVRGGEDLPSAEMILANMRALLPRTPLVIRGQLTTSPYGKREGVKLHVDIELDWSREPLMARYTVRDAFGLDLPLPPLPVRCPLLQIYRLALEPGRQPWGC